jgi:predicted RNA-binding protein YlqC (UPF0109 family)
LNPEREGGEVELKREGEREEVLQFIRSYLQLVVTRPERLELSIIDEGEEEFGEILILADKSDVGRIIGKKGLLISSLKNLIDGCKAKGWRNYRITVKGIGE